MQSSNTKLSVLETRRKSIYPAKYKVVPWCVHMQKGMEGNTGCSLLQTDIFVGIVEELKSPLYEARQGQGKYQAEHGTWGEGGGEKAAIRNVKPLVSSS